MTQSIDLGWRSSPQQVSPPFFRGTDIALPLPINLCLILPRCWSLFKYEFLIGPRIRESRITSEPVLFVLALFGKAESPLECVVALVRGRVGGWVRFDKLSRCGKLLKLRVLVDPELVGSFVHVNSIH